MNRSFKATIAGGAAVVLLAGGATTFARWYDEQDVTVSSVESGQLSFTATEGEWLINSLDDAAPSIAFDPAAGAIVPGDVVTFTTEVTPVLVGENLEATFTATLNGQTVDGIDVATTVEDPAGEAVSVLTEADSAQPFTAEVTITFPETAPDGSDWNLDLQGETLDLTNLQLELTQNAR